MEFKVFSKTLRTNIGGGKNASDFAREMFFYITVPNAETSEILNLDADTYKKYALGTRSLKSFSQKILPYIDKERFEDYLIEKCSLAVSANIIAALATEGFITCQTDFIDDVTELFCDFLRTAAMSGRSAAKSAGGADDANIKTYLSHLREKFYSTKTLLYTVAPKPINDFYVPNDLYDPQYSHSKKRIRATDVLLAFKKRFIVITGTGGLGKTMLIRHLVLAMVKGYSSYKKLPIVIQLRDFTDSCTNLADFIADHVPLANIRDYMEKGDCVFLLDGMDEIKSDYLKLFEKLLSEMAEKYPRNNFIMSSRPISNFISLNKFIVYELAPFTKEQALEMIDRVEYCPETPELKENFRKALAEKLYDQHTDFVEIPLLLTIMLMTYERHARIPAKRYLFYREAFDTLVEKHDATKVGFERVYQTKMFPDEFVKVLEEFCTATYFNEQYDLTEEEFDQIFDELRCVPRMAKRFTCKDFKTDLTANLCLMYFEGGKYKFIHRSFQEYFCALLLSKGFDDDFVDVWQFFDRKKRTVKEDFTFDMLYDMAEERVERFIFIPFLEDLFSRCKADTQTQEYWNFLEIVYPEMHYTVGDVHYSYTNEPFSYIYVTILKKLGCERKQLINVLPYVEEYERERYLRVEQNGETEIIAAEDYDERDDYDEVEECGHNCTFIVAEVRRTKSALKRKMEERHFPYMIEYIEVKKLFADMKQRDAITGKRGWVKKKG